MAVDCLRPRVALALQGGGSHGAYGWGAIERFLQEDVEIVAISGASAGALNGAAVVAGMSANGRKGALEGLERLWTTVARLSPLRTLDGGWLPGSLMEPWIRLSLQWGKLLSPLLSPLMPGVRDMSVLRRIVSETIDLSGLRRGGAIPLHISATRVANGSARLFGNEEIDLDALMASACLPEVFAAVRIDGEEFWDGGYSANPALEPLLLAEDATDILILQITPFDVDKVHHSLSATVARISDIGFNACLLRDLKALTELQEALRESPSPPGALRPIERINLHLVQASPELSSRGPASKSDTRPSTLQNLRRIGYETMDAWLSEHRPELGHRSTITRQEAEAA